MDGGPPRGPARSRAWWASGGAPPLRVQSPGHAKTKPFLACPPPPCPPKRCPLTKLTSSALPFLTLTSYTSVPGLHPQALQDLTHMRPGSTVVRTLIEKPPHHRPQTPSLGGQHRGLESEGGQPTGVGRARLSGLELLSLHCSTLSSVPPPKIHLSQKGASN